MTSSPIVWMGSIRCGNSSVATPARLLSGETRSHREDEPVLRDRDPVIARSGYRIGAALRYS